MHKYFSCCFYCQSSIVWRWGLCFFCARIFEEHIKPGTLNIDPNLKVCYLIPWKKNHSRVVQSFLLGLKGGARTDVFNELASLFCAQFDKPTGCSRAIIPIPGSHRWRRHSHTLAQEIFSQTCCQTDLLLECLERKSTVSQKQLSRGQRRQIFLCSSEKFTSPMSLIFVDDVLTTGQSALAAWRAVGSPPSSQIWVIAYRSQLAAHA